MRLVHLIGFITKKFVTMHGHMNVKLLVKLRLWSQQPQQNGKCFTLKLKTLLSFETPENIYLSTQSLYTPLGRGSQGVHKQGDVRKNRRIPKIHFSEQGAKTWKTRVGKLRTVELHNVVEK